MTRIVVDCETIPLPDAADYLDEITAPSNYKDEEKIAAYVEAKKAEQVDKCSRDPDLCKVVAIGWLVEGWDIEHVTGDEWGEGAMLAAFWDATEDCQLVSFNGLEFDLPILMRRSLYLGIPYPHIQIDRFRHDRVIDLMQDLSFAGKFRYHGLRFYARRFGLPLPEDSIDGSGIAQAVAEGNWKTVSNHVQADVQLTAALAERMGLFKTAVSFPPSGGEGSLVGSTSPSVSPALLVESEPLAPQSPETVGQSGR